MDSMHVKRTDSGCCVSRSRRGGHSEGESSVLEKGVGEDDFIN